ncbi:MAG: tetratricopeptide repeat protein [Pirellulales bacterium]
MAHPSRSRWHPHTHHGWAVVLGGLMLAGGAPHGRGDDAADVAAMIQSVDALRARGKYTQAIETAQKALATAETAFGRDDPRTTTAQAALGAAYLEVANHAAAAPLLREAVAWLERAEPRDLSTLGCVLGDLAQAVDRPSEAEPLYRRSLELAEQVHGPDHPATGLALNNLGAFLRDEGRADEAEPLMRRALRIRERAEGMGSPLAAQSLCTLGLIAADLGDMSVAESLVRSSLEQRRAAFTHGHPEIAESCLTLARILIVFGKDRADEALKLASEALAGYRAALGPTNSLTLRAMHAKADALAAVGRQAEAERVHQDLIAALDTLPATQADALAESLREFAQHLVEAGKAARAADLCRRAITLRQKAHGPDDARVLAMRQVLAEALYAEGKPDKAVAEGRAILASMAKQDDTARLDTVTARYALAKYLLAIGELEEARSLLEQSVGLFEKATGRGSRQTLDAMYRLAVTYVVTDDLAEAERIVDDGLERFSAAKDVRTGDAAADLIGLRAVIYRKTGRVKEAEEAEAAVRQAEAGRRR